MHSSTKENGGDTDRTDWSVYMPVCRQHYVSGQVVKETAKTVLESQYPVCLLCIVQLLSRKSEISCSLHNLSIVKLQLS